MYFLVLLAVVLCGTTASHGAAHSIVWQSTVTRTLPLNRGAVPEAERSLLALQLSAAVRERRSRSVPVRVLLWLGRRLQGALGRLSEGAEEPAAAGRPHSHPTVQVAHRQHPAVWGPFHLWVRAHEGALGTQNGTIHTSALVRQTCTPKMQVIARNTQS